MTDEITRLTPSLPRRILGAGTLVVVGAGLLVAVSVASGPLVWLGALAVVGAVLLAQALRVWRGTSTGLILRASGLFAAADDSEIALIANIVRVDRSLFAFKPANGFLLHLAEPMSVRWVPGLYWRFGRKLGVGGMTPGGEGKAMADVIAALVADKTP